MSSKKAGVKYERPQRRKERRRHCVETASRGKDVEIKRFLGSMGRINKPRLGRRTTVSIGRCLDTFPSGA